MRAYRRSVSIREMLNDPNELWFERDPRKRKALIRATPSWANASSIRLVYEKCQELNERFPGQKFVVHHDVPISHPKVCGLHVPANLRVVSSSLKKALGRKLRD